jgi:hypothetical protein
MRLGWKEGKKEEQTVYSGDHESRNEKSGQEKKDERNRNSCLPASDFISDFLAPLGYHQAIRR